MVFQDLRQASKQSEEIENCREVKRIDFMFIGKSFENGPVVEKLNDNAFYEYYHDFLS